jgi:flavodoxin
MAKALVVYFTVTGHTKKAAEDIGKGMENKGIEVSIKSVVDFSQKDVEPVEIVVFGSPTHLSRPATKIKEAMEKLEERSLKGKWVSAFTCMAIRGGDKVLKSLEEMLKEKGAKNFIPGVVIHAGALLSLVKGRDASPEDVEKCEKLGESLASKC